MGSNPTLSAIYFQALKGVADSSAAPFCCFKWRTDGVTNLVCHPAASSRRNSRTFDPDINANASRSFDSTLWA